MHRWPRRAEPRTRAAAAEQRRPGAKPLCVRRHGSAGAATASAAPQVAPPRGPCDGDRLRTRHNRAEGHTQRTRTAGNSAQSQGREQLPRSSDGQARRRRACGGTTAPARRPRVRRRRQRRRESRATATAHTGHDAIAPRATRRDRAPPTTPRYAKFMSSRRGGAAAERNAAASAAARPSRREERQRGAAGGRKDSDADPGTQSPSLENRCA